jgi:hypothetical protein
MGEARARPRGHFGRSECLLRGLDAHREQSPTEVLRREIILARKAVALEAS